MTHIDFLVDRFRSHRDADAVIWRDRTFSYGDLCAAIDRASEQLQRNDIRPGTVVSLEADFSPASIAMLLALVARECVVVPLTVALEGSKPALRRIAEVETIIEITAADTAVQATGVAAKHALIGILRQRHHPGLVIFSSGSTGTSKAALHDLVPLLDQFRRPGLPVRAISFLLFDHIGGINTLFSILGNGGCLVLVDERSPERVCEAIARHHVELLPVTPTFLNLLLVSEAYRHWDLASLTIVSYGTEVMPAATLRRLQDALPRVKPVQKYGSSELGILQSKTRSGDGLWLKIGDERCRTRVVNGYFAHQYFGWHEYGAYLGPIIIGLIALSPLVFRRQWPWLASAGGCFLIALGNFAPIAPWTLLHNFPVMSNARVPTRFLMPCVLALAISAGFVFDTLRARVKEWFKGTRREWATDLLVALCLADLVLVGGRSFEGPSTAHPSRLRPRNPHIVTIAGRASNMLGPMLQNYCTKNAYEEARIPVSVSAVDEGSYRGEVYFVPGREARAQRRTESPSSTAIIVRWSPNTVNVLVNASVSGWLVVNRNWNDGWISSPPYHAQPRNGLLAATLESGEHLVQFSYRPKSVMVGAAISFFSVIAAALGCWLDWDLGKRRNSR